MIKNSDFFASERKRVFDGRTRTGRKERGEVNGEREGEGKCCIPCTLWCKPRERFARPRLPVSSLEDKMPNARKQSRQAPIWVNRSIQEVTEEGVSKDILLTPGISITVAGKMEKRR